MQLVIFLMVWDSKFPVGLAHPHGPHEVLERDRKTHVFFWGGKVGFGGPTRRKFGSLGFLMATFFFVFWTLFGRKKVALLNPFRGTKSRGKLPGAVTSILTYSDLFLTTHGLGGI